MHLVFVDEASSDVEARDMARAARWISSNSLGALQSVMGRLARAAIQGSHEPPAEPTWPYVGGRNPGEEIHSLMRAAVSA